MCNYKPIFCLPLISKMIEQMFQYCFSTLCLNTTYWFLINMVSIKSTQHIWRHSILSTKPWKDWILRYAQLHSPMTTAFFHNNLLVMGSWNIFKLVPELLKWLLSLMVLPHHKFVAYWGSTRVHFRTTTFMMYMMILTCLLIRFPLLCLLMTQLFLSNKNI